LSPCGCTTGRHGSLNAGITAAGRTAELTTTSASAKPARFLAGAGLAGVEDEPEALVGLQVVLAELRLLPDGLLHSKHDRQEVVVDVDQLDRVLRGGLAAGHDHRDGLTDVVDLLDGDEGVPGVDHAGVTGHAQGSNLLRGEVAAGEDGDDARCVLGRRQVDVRDLRVATGLRRWRDASIPGRVMLSSTWSCR
jgi:hypothetical protein